MTLDDLLLGGGVGTVAVLSLLEIAPIKVNPWSAIARGLGRAFNAEVLADLKAVQQAQQDTRSALDKHQAADDRRRTFSTPSGTSTSTRTTAAAIRGTKTTGLPTPSQTSAGYTMSG